LTEPPHASVLAAYYLKGGVAMELRFAERAGATKDLDLGMEGTRASWLKSLSDALSVGFDQFTFRIKAPTRDMEQADTVRVLVAVQYRTRSWQTIEMDLGPANVDRVDLIEPRVRGLFELGIPVISPVRCLGLAERVAQKLHACTGPAAQGRARDVLDILLIDALGQLNYTETAHAARRVFEERGTHLFAPAFAMPPEWAPELESLANEVGFILSTAGEIEGRFLEVIRLLQHATPTDEWRAERQNSTQSSPPRSRSRLFLLPLVNEARRLTSCPRARSAAAVS